MNDLSGVPAEVHFQLSITRAATGKVEVYDMVGHVIDVLPEEAAQPTETKES